MGSGSTILILPIQKAYPLVFALTKRLELLSESASRTTKLHMQPRRTWDPSLTSIRRYE